jgi:hypothetical protein
MLSATGLIAIGLALFVDAATPFRGQGEPQIALSFIFFSPFLGAGLGCLFRRPFLGAALGIGLFVLLGLMEFALLGLKEIASAQPVVGFAVVFDAFLVGYMITSLRNAMPKGSQ